MVKHCIRGASLFVVSLLFISFLPSVAKAALIIEPALIQIDLTQKRSSGTFVIKNTGDKEERYRAKAVHYIFTPEGAIKRVAPDEYSLAEWIKFNPKEFTLPPKSSKAVRYSVIPQGKLKTHEYWCAIEFVPLEHAQYKTSDDKGRTFNIAIVSVIMVPIHGLMEGVQYSGEIKRIYVEKSKKGDLYLHCAVANTGGGALGFQGTYTITDSSGNKVVDQAPFSVEVYPGSERISKTKINTELASGKYSVQINLTSNSSRANISLSDESEFTI